MMPFVTEKVVIKASSRIMAVISINLLTVAMVVVVVCGPRNGKGIYRPYGIKMCKGLSQNSTDCFIYTVRTLTCRCVSSNDTTAHALKLNSTGTFVFCLKEKTTVNRSITALAVLPRDDRLTEQSKGYLGCYKNDKNRLMKGFSMIDENSYMTQDWCIDHCRQSNFKYAGLQDFRECHCGNKLNTNPLMPEDNCNSPCRGNSSQMCGGIWRISVFKIE